MAAQQFLNEPTTFEQQPSARAVILDPDEAGRRVMRQRLTSEGFVVETARRSSELLLAIDRRPADLVICGVEGSRGIEQLAMLRQHTDAPVLALIWPHRGLDIADALDGGADDALMRPFTPRDLGARSRALVRRFRRVQQFDPKARQVLQFEGLTIDLGTRDVILAERRLSIPAREFDLLFHLASRPRVVFTRAELLRDVWDAGVHELGAATVTEHVRRLRRRIERPGTPCRIVTLRGVGYQFDPGPRAPRPRFDAASPRVLT